MDSKVVSQDDFKLFGSNMAASIHHLSFECIEVIWLSAEFVSVLPIDLRNNILLIFIEGNVIKESYFTLLWWSFNL